MTATREKENQINGQAAKPSPPPKTHYTWLIQPINIAHVQTRIQPQNTFISQYIGTPNEQSTIR